MKELIIFYVGFTMGLCFMDFIDVKNHWNLHMYRHSLFNIVFTMLFAPLVFPFYVIKNILGSAKG